MKSNNNPLHELIREERPYAVHRNGIVHFQPVPLFLLLATLLDNDAIMSSIYYALEDDLAAPDSLDPQNDHQTDRVETAILRLTSSLVEIRELVIVEYRKWADWHVLSICMVKTPEDSLLAYYMTSQSPSFFVFAYGAERPLLIEMTKHSDSIIPRIIEDADQIIRVTILEDSITGLEDASNIVHAVAGLPVKPLQVLCPGLLPLE